MIELLRSAFRPVCAHVQPQPVTRLWPYVCSRPRWHLGRHTARLDGRVLARW